MLIDDIMLFDMISFVMTLYMNRFLPLSREGISSYPRTWLKHPAGGGGGRGTAVLGLSTTGSIGRSGQGVRGDDVGLHAKNDKELV